MTIEELADLTSDKLKALSEEELRKILEPYFNVTRPERIEKVTVSKPAAEQIYLSPQKKAALAMLAEEGVDMSFLKGKRRK